MPSKRPEHIGPPELFYDNIEASKYSSNSRIIEIQEQLSQRAIELLNLPDDGEQRLLLDIGCGSGLSGDCISEQCHWWIGVDISQSMLDIAVEREVEGDLLLADMGAGIPFRPGTFDGVISISALQWLCNSDKSNHNPIKRFSTFFSTLYGSMAYGSRAVFQVYPENDSQLNLMTAQAMRSGFGGGVVVDFPESTKAKKVFLVLFAGGYSSNQLPEGLDSHHITESDEKAHVLFTKNVPRHQRNDKKRAPVKSRVWIMEKKERQRKKGQDTRPDSKYTGRRRKTF